MDILTLTLSALYGDHHVTEVRRILLDIPGVEAVYASSCFQVVRVTYDPEQTNAALIGLRLHQAGYLENLRVPSEAGVAAVADREATYFRPTAAYEQTGRVVGFAQNVPSTGNGLWPCPGMDAIRAEEDSHAEERA